MARTGVIWIEARKAWMGRAVIGRKADGKPDRRTVYAKSEAECIAKLGELTHKARVGEVLPSHKLTLRAYVEKTWLPTLEQGPGPRTHYAYSSMMKLHILPLLGHLPLHKITPSDVQHMLNRKAELSGQSRRHLRTCLSSALTAAMKDSLIMRNVARLIDAPKCERKSAGRTPLTAEQASAYLRAARGTWLEHAAVLMVSTGLRTGELCGLKWDAIDWERARVRIFRTAQGIIGADGRYRLEVLDMVKTESSRREIPLTPEAVEALRAQQQRVVELAYDAGQRWADEGFVFPNNAGRVVEPRRMGRHHRKALRCAGLPDVDFYALRHTAATLSLQGGFTVREVATMLGHSSTRVTESTYLHHTEKQHETLARKMAARDKAIKASA